MTIRLQRTENCCGGGLIHALGHAHGETTYLTFEDFSKALFTACHITNSAGTGVYSFYYAFTNTQQITEREWLKKLGFEEKKITNVSCHTITGNNLRKYYTTVYAKEIEEENKRREARLEAQRIAREKAEQKKHEAKEAKRKEREALGILPRKPGEFRIDDKVYQWCWDGSVGLNRFGSRRRYGIVIGVHEDGSISVQETRGDRRITRLTPIVSNGHREGNIQRKVRSGYYW